MSERLTEAENSRLTRELAEAKAERDRALLWIDVRYLTSWCHSLTGRRGR
jgi:hypothetical protein